MKKNTKAMLVSIGILAVIAIVLVVWVQLGSSNKATSTEKKETGQVDKKQEASAKQDIQQEEKQKETQETGNGEVPAGQEEQVQEPETQQDVTVVFSGDILLSSYVLNNYEKSGINGILSEELQSEMQNADITMVNEEFPFSNRGTQAQDKQFTFRVDPGYVKILQEMGIDVVTVANNHALDYGTDALSDTFQTLDNAGIAYVGAGDNLERASQPYVIKAGGKTFGFLAASRVIPEVSWNIDNRQPGMLCTYDSAELCNAIQKAKETCDYVVVYVHWGIERENTPQDYQRQLGKAYIDAGADMVIGAHPHVLQGIEYYNGKPIVYSLGNYIFNQEINSTVLLKTTITPENETTLQLIPAYASGAKTQKMQGEDGAQLYQFMEGISYGVSISKDGVVERIGE
ncbi:MAG: CapA family protein [Clostridiales bacterium]|uniref:CapA family protein n=1 Tax=Roseburia sp. MSJ-14 TaxID=2841514 RepID=UPI0016AB42FB|nr:CapA family protein [Roseburia sp. MSJ-14]MBU5472270.1 CapA family protein [Roseburia sp. MSJ-14]NLK78872.1 CapA family protein [Clostridiales bacterium]